jgi:hypothetical protein
MSSGTRKDTLFNSVVLFAAWLVVIAACVADDVDVDAGTHLVRIAYRAQ